MRASAGLAILLTGVSVSGVACGRSGQESSGARPAIAAAASAEMLDSAPRRWPNEPAGFVPFNDQSWDRFKRTREGRLGRAFERAEAILFSRSEQESPWGYLRRASSKDDDTVFDSTAPFSPPHVLRIRFTTDMKPDHEPSVHWLGLSKPTEIYAGWWIKLSANWKGSSTCCGKMTFLFPDENGAGIAYSNLTGVDGSRYVNVATTWPSTGYKFWQPNVTRTRVSDGEWYRIEWHVKWESRAGANDGIIRWWVNGELNGDYHDVPFPPAKGFVEFQHAPTLHRPPPEQQYMYIDHTYLSTPATR